MIRALDLFCKAGGASAGLAMAGFDVTGVDISPQPNYSGKFIQMDVLDLEAWAIKDQYDFVWASPPCQSYSDLAKRNGNGHEWPRLIAPIRLLLQKTGLPYVIENVEGAPLLNPVRLCGTQFKACAYCATGCLRRISQSTLCRMASTPSATPSTSGRPISARHASGRTSYRSLAAETRRLRPRRMRWASGG